MENFEIIALCESCYDEYLETGSEYETEHEHAVHEASAEADAKMKELGAFTDEMCEILGEYEEAARRAGFYAGYKAALLMMKQKEES